MNSRAFFALFLAGCADAASLGAASPKFADSADETASFATASATPTFRHGYLGVTSTARAGDAGYGTMIADCQALFPRSHVCTDEEIVTTRTAPVPGANAWILGTVGAISSSGYMYTKYGVSIGAAYGLNCNGSGGGHFSYADYRSVYLAADGDMSATNCTQSLVVACCA